MFSKASRLSIIPHKENPYRWDGTHLGKVSVTSITGRAISQDNTYWSLVIDGYRATCLVKNFTTTFPIIVDELKPVFGLHKLGTHTVDVEGKRYILTKAIVNLDATIAEDIPLSLIDDKTCFRRYDGNSFCPLRDKVFLGQVRDIFAFRELLGISPSYEKCVKIRIPVTDRTEGIGPTGGIGGQGGTGGTGGRENRPYPISHWEAVMSPQSIKTVTSQKVINKWFSRYTINQAVSDLLDITQREDILPKLSTLRSRIENVIYRVDRQSIWVSLYIIERAMNRMLLYTTQSSKPQAVILPQIEISSKTSKTKDKDD
jgi:hypothetical protein